MSVKEAVKQLIDALPEDASIDDIMDALYVRAKIERGEREIRQGKGIPHKEARKRILRKWAKPLAWGVVMVVALAQVCAVAGEGKLQILQPLGRTAYQTNEAIDLAVVRSSPEALAAGNLVLNVAGADGSKMSFTLPVRAVAVQGKKARTTEHLHLTGWLLRPGKYTIEVACDGATAKADLDVYSHLRKSDFKLINWGRALKQARLVEGEDSLGFNLIYGHYTNDDDASYLRAGVDFMPNCVMSGGHQMDLRIECDWSDPYVVRGGTARVVRRALFDRTRPNVCGVHFYDEPGLTWGKDPVTGQGTPHLVPSQHRSYQSAFDRPAPIYREIQANNPADVLRWRHWAYWKLAFMNAAWMDSQFGVSYVVPWYLSVTQSQYGFSAFTDGYYFNVVACLPVISGHGGYHDWGPGYFNPSYTLELARARDLAKPCWYLPTWYGNTTSDEFRLEQYLSFQTNIQGMISPPDIDPFQPASKPSAEGVVESNHLMGRLGPIFNTMPVTRPPVAMLFSLSHMINEQVKNPAKVAYAHDTEHGRNIPFTYLAGTLLQQPFMTVVDEDITDGTLAANHNAVILTSIAYLDPPVVTALEEFAAKGGLVLTTSDCTVQIKGATNLGVTPAMPDAALIKKMQDEKRKGEEMAPYFTTGKWLDGAKPLAAAIKTQLDKAGIKPVFWCDNPGIVATRQTAGDIEYLFAVNAAYDYEAGKLLSLKPVAAKLAFPDDRRPIYDAVRGGSVGRMIAWEVMLQATYRFGPGQMRVFARTARPIGTVKALAPVLTRDLTLEKAPIQVALGATLLDSKGGVLAGSAPLEIQVIDPLGVTRYDLFRATRQGTLTLSLPLAANDPAGQWKVVVRELLNNTEDTATFAYQPMERCGALAGATRRAVMFAQDFANIHRFARVHRSVTIVKGSSDYNAAAAERIKKILDPWDVKCAIVNAADVNHPRELSPEEAPTWVGLAFGRVQPGTKNSPAHVGFAVGGAVILLGTPEDNPLIDFLSKERFLPYPPKAGEFPGGGRGYLAWQRDGVGLGQESVTLIAHDAAGMSEAVGSLYEAVAGMEPLTPWEMPTAQSVGPATTAPGLLPELKVAWTAVLPDRVVAMKAGGNQLSVLTHDDSLSTVSAEGKVTEARAVAAAEVSQVVEQLRPAPQNASRDLPKDALPSDRIVKILATSGGITAVGFWGGTLILYDAAGAPKSCQQMPQDITGLAWLGDRLIVGLADGRVVALAAK